MIIFGVAFLALCTLTGIFVGELLGKLLTCLAHINNPRTSCGRPG